MNIDQIIDKYFELRSQGKSHEEAYDIIILQGYPKELVDLCLIKAIEFSEVMQEEILRMVKSGFSPKEVFQVLVDEGYPEPLIRANIEPLLDPEEF